MSAYVPSVAILRVFVSGDLLLISPENSSIREEKWMLAQRQAKGNFTLGSWACLQTFLLKELSFVCLMAYQKR